MVKIVLTGPESTGKTTLAQQLHGSIGGSLLIPEFARIYLYAKGSDYQYDDFLAMAKGQIAWENWYLEKKSPCLLLDTDFTVFSIWAMEAYAQVPGIIKTWQEQATERYYLLCKPDLSWQPDPLREHPDERERLFLAYQSFLDTHQLPYTLIEGVGAARLEAAQKAIAILIP